jgi:cell division transport system permease protein
MFSIWYWFKEALIGLKRNYIRNLGAIITSAICLFVFSIFLISGMNAKYFADVLEHKMEMKVHLKDEVTDYEEVQNRIEAMPEVQNVRFISKDEAFQEMKSKLGKDAEILGELGEEAFPAGYVVSLYNVKKIEKVAEEVDSWGIAEDIGYGKEFIQYMFSITDAIKSVGLWASLVMAFIAGMFVFTAIRNNIVARHTEIEIKDLIGAGFLRIRIPFIIEAVVLTTISSFGVYYSLVYGYTKMVVLVQKHFPYAPFLDQESVTGKLFAPLIILAIVIGLVSSVLSTQRFIKRSN